MQRVIVLQTLEKGYRRMFFGFVDGRLSIAGETIVAGGRISSQVKRASTIVLDSCVVELGVYRQILKPGVIENLSLRLMEVYNEAIAIIAQMTNLRALHLEPKNPDGLDFAPLAALINLETVSFESMPNFTDDDLLSVVANLTQLKTMCLKATGCTGRGLGILRSLESLNLDNTPASDQSLAELRSATLQSLSVVGTKVTVSGLISLDWTTLPNLRGLWVSYTTPRSEIQRFQSIHNRPVMEVDWS